MPTPKQVTLIHVAKSRIGLTDPQYRMLLRNVAGVGSCKDLDQAGVEDVMAVMEDSGFQDKEGGTYWRDKVRRRGAECGERMRRKIEALAADQQYPLAAMVHRHSNKRTDRVEQLYPREAWNLIEALKAIVDRHDIEPAVIEQQQLALSADECPF